MRRTQTIAAAASLTIATAMLLARPALALTLAPRGDIPACDATGDRKRDDDCLRHAYLGGTKDGAVPQHGKVSLGLALHRSMWGSSLAGEVQYRRLNAEGDPIGPWSPMAGFVLQPRHTRDGAVDAILSCAPEYRGTYEMRVALAPTKATEVALQSRVGSTDDSSGLPASFTEEVNGVTLSGNYITSGPTTVTTTANTQCLGSPSDEANVEYFNMLEFNDELEVVGTPMGPPAAPTGVAVSLVCPAVTNPALQDLRIALSTADGAQSTGCGGAPITFEYATLTQPTGRDRCAENAPDCVDIAMTASSVSTGTVYSSTEIALTLASPSFTILPQLQPATVPICNNTFSWGVTAPASQGTLTLVSGLNGPSSPMAYSSSSQAYFQVALRDTLQGP